MRAHQVALMSHTYASLPYYTPKLPRRQGRNLAKKVVAGGRKVHTNTLYPEQEGVIL
jgi:hypothetical protein